ncbi:hypothetical protein ACFSOZ_25980 [Mesorhizobium newzealandense]|uniref:Uncharacterized protein n=1 Tax=Mesorhizobium newzealandense TaxID=1300302 RepID=A0ABW4UHT8_9HYPH
MTDFNATERRANALARRLLRDGHSSRTISDAFITNALALWAAKTGNHIGAALLTRAWARIADRNEAR